MVKVAWVTAPGEVLKRGVPAELEAGVIVTPPTPAVAGLLNGSCSVAVSAPELTPAVAEEAPESTSLEGAAAATVIVAVVPLMVALPVSVAVIVRLPAWVRVAVKVLLPLSPARKV